MNISKIRPSFRALGLLSLVFLGTFALLGPASAAESIDSFVASYDVQADGTIDVIEEITWDFGTATDRHGIFRDLILSAKCAAPREDAEQPLYPCEEGKRRRWQ